MAAVEKIYGTRSQYFQLLDFFLACRKKFLIYLDDPDRWSGETGVIAEFPIEAEIWILARCGLPWLRKKVFACYYPEEAHELPER